MNGRYIFVFGINFSRNYISVTRKFISGISFAEITYHELVCDSENYMDKLFGNYFLGSFHFSYTKQCFQNEFRNNFWLECIEEQRSGRKKCCLRALLETALSSHKL